jgi:NAD(P)-dependent dehydrogenase (short-subunit alcohol dehydrogenase family)
VLVNNAGIVARGPLDEMPVETWDAVLDANLKGTFLVTRAFLPAMRSAAERPDRQRRVDLRTAGDGAADGVLRGRSTASSA